MNLHDRKEKIENRDKYINFLNSDTKYKVWDRMLYSTETSSNNLPKDETKYDSEINTQNWMKELPSEIKSNAHISSLSIPGSHDSFTYSLVR